MILSDIVIDENDPVISQKIREHLRNQTYEQNEISLMNTVVQPGDSVLEIGGGIGFTAAYLAKRFGCSVSTVEPHPDCARMIRKTLNANGVTANIFNSAAGLKRGRVRFHVDRDFWASHTHNATGNTIEVEQLALDDLIADAMPDVILMDCEGAEIEMLLNCNFSDVRAMVVEFHPKVTGEPAVRSAINRLYTLGYNIRRESNYGVMTR